MLGCSIFLDCRLLCFSREEEFSKFYKFYKVEVEIRFWSVQKKFGPSCFFRLYRKKRCQFLIAFLLRKFLWQSLQQLVSIFPAINPHLFANFHSIWINLHPTWPLCDIFQINILMAQNNSCLISEKILKGVLPSFIWKFFWEKIL